MCGRDSDEPRLQFLTVDLAVYRNWLKPCLDAVLAACAFVVLLPAMGVVAVAVRITLGSPVFFFDERAGRGGTPIWVMKFRSMSNAVDADGKQLCDEQRLGLFGRILRRTSLDELPQLLNVVVGQMSLVGPRPLPTRYTHRYNARQATRLQVRPGLTGWAQIHGRNSLNWPERLEYDAQYVEKLAKKNGLGLDAWILVVTAAQVVRQVWTGSGISGPGSATMREFNP